MKHVPALVAFKRELEDKAVARMKALSPSKYPALREVTIDLTGRVIYMRDLAGRVLTKYGISEEGQLVYYDQRSGK